MSTGKKANVFGKEDVKKIARCGRRATLLAKKCMPGATKSHV